MTNEYKKNYRAFLQLPMVQKLIAQNKALKAENKALRKVITVIPITKEHECCKNDNQTRLVHTTTTNTPYQEMTQDIVDLTDDNNYIPVSDVEDENITYSFENPHWDYDKIKANIGMKIKTENSIEETIEDDDTLGGEDIAEDEFKCDECSTIQGLNNCELCDAENVCEECHGQGGDYGPHEIWVCNKCLPTCNGCGKKLFSAIDDCCGKGRSDIEEEEEVVEEEEEEEEEEVVEEEEEAESEDAEEEEGNFTCVSCGTNFDCKIKKTEYKDNIPDDECSFCGTKFDNKWAEQYKSVNENKTSLTYNAEEEEEEEVVEEESEEEEEVVEEEEEEEEEVVEEESEEEEEVVEEGSEEEEEEVFEIEIDGVSYYTTNEQNGVIYAIDADEEVGDRVGKLVAGTAVFDK